MIGLLQRVSEASISVDGQAVASIGAGLAVLVAVQGDDQPRDVERLASRILGYRVFADADGRMNRSLVDAGGELLLVPQFTLAADTRKGSRASFSGAAAPDKARRYFDDLADRCRQRLQTVECGRFGADMRFALVNEGPVTFWLES